MSTKDQSSDLNACLQETFVRLLHKGPQACTQKFLLKTKQPYVGHILQSRVQTWPWRQMDEKNHPTPHRTKSGITERKGQGFRREVSTAPTPDPQTSRIPTARWDNLGTYFSTRSGSLCNYPSAGSDDCCEREAAVFFPFSLFSNRLWKFVCILVTPFLLCNL